MIEAPEAYYLCKQLNETVRGKKITDVFTQFSPHKFAWFTGSSEEYAEWLYGKAIEGKLSEYYLAAKSKPQVMSEAFTKEYFLGMINDKSVEKKSAKAFLATEQTIPGLGKL